MATALPTFRWPSASKDHSGRGSDGFQDCEFSPATVPQSALLIADNPGDPPVFDFEEGNDNVQALLPPSMPVQRVNIRTEPSNAQATTDIVNGMNQGKAIITTQATAM